MSLVSVIMPAYNASNTIEESIESVIKQTFTDFEFIIVDDCSSDDTTQIIATYAGQDKRIKFVRNKANFGVSYTRNYAVSLALGKWIAFIDSDDIWEETKLAKQISFAQEHSEARLIYTASAFIDWKGEPSSYVMPAILKTDYKTIIKKNLLSCSSVMVKKELIQKIKMPSDNMHEDYATWLMLLREINFAYGINKPLLFYRLSKNSKSSNRLKSAKMIFNTYHYVGYSKIMSFILTLQYSIHSITKRIKISNGKKSKVNYILKS